MDFYVRFFVSDFYPDLLNLIFFCIKDRKCRKIKAFFLFELKFFYNLKWIQIQAQVHFPIGDFPTHPLIFFKLNNIVQVTFKWYLVGHNSRECCKCIRIYITIHIFDSQVANSLLEERTYLLF